MTGLICLTSGLLLLRPGIGEISGQAGQALLAGGASPLPVP